MRRHALHALLAQTENPFFHEDAPNHDLDYCLWHASKSRHPKHFHAASFTGAPPPGGAPPGGAPPGGAPPGGAPPAGGEEGKTDGDEKGGGSEGAETIEYQLENGKSIQLSAESEEKCQESCKNAPELKDNAEGESKGSMAMNIASGGEQAMMSGCIRFCQTEFQIQCFPATSTVVVRDKGRIPLSDLRTGDLVMVMHRNSSWTSAGKASDYALRFEPVISWLHHEPDAKMEVVQVRHALGEVNLSPDHMIFAKRPGSGCFVATMAREVSVGDQVLAPWIDGTLVEPEVTSISHDVACGAYTPLMPSGALFVDGTAVSCYTVPNDLKSSPTYAALLNGLKGMTGRESAHDLAHMLMLPVRLFHQSAAQWRADSRAISEVKDPSTVKLRDIGPLATVGDKSIEDHVHPYGLFLYVLCKSFIS